jgi:hypothetical protein
VLADVDIVRLKGVDVTGRERRGGAAGRPPAEGCGGGRRPVKVTVDNPGALDVDTGVLLLAAFVVGGLVKDGSADAAHRRSG